jgi:hypothetical protein
MRIFLFLLGWVILQLFLLRMNYVVHKDENKDETIGRGEQ